MSICHQFVKKVNRKVQELINVLMFFLISVSMCCNSAFCFLELIILISKVGYPESKQGVETVTLSSMSSLFHNPEILHISLSQILFPVN